MPPVTRPEHQRPGARRADRARDLHLPASRHIGIDRQRARPYDGHGRLTASGSLPAIGAKPGEEGSHTFKGDSRILTRPKGARRQDRQRARPDTRQGRSGNQAVNNQPAPALPRRAHRPGARPHDPQRPRRGRGNTRPPRRPAGRLVRRRGHVTAGLLSPPRRPVLLIPRTHPLRHIPGRHADEARPSPSPGNCPSRTAGSYRCTASYDRHRVSTRWLDPEAWALGPKVTLRSWHQLTAVVSRGPVRGPDRLRRRVQ